jgi:UDP-N-acetylmuramate: L-alanyl-gamma-D-glutamyl-meso-diaminopimelate ligase
MNKKHIHFVGICGTAMGNVAIGLKNAGHKVTGSDKGAYPPISTLLKNNNIEILNFNENNVKNSDLVVIGNAIPRGNVEAEFVLNNKIPYLSLPETINRFFLKNKKLILVTGTHGKTTTTSLIAHILKYSGLNPSFMIGGIPKNFDTGFYENKQSQYFVMEGDEYDTAFFDKTSKFLKFSPDYLIVNYIEFDHGDIFENINQIKKSFQHLLKRTPSNAKIFLNRDDKNSIELEKHSYSTVKTFGQDKLSDYCLEKVDYIKGKTKFTIKNKNEKYNVYSSLTGIHNGRNVTASFAVAKELGIDTNTVLKAIESFKGVGRRMEKKWENKAKNIEIYEDFAHHPTAIKETLKGAKTKFDNKKVLAIFEPATNTIRSGFFDIELKSALSYADKTIILPIPDKKTVGANDTFNSEVFENSDKFKIITKIEEFEKIFKKHLNENQVVIFLSNGSLQGTLKIAEKIIGEVK